MIKQVPPYAKILKDLCTVKRGLNINKKAFLTEQVSAIIECKTPVKYKDPGCPTISVNIGNTVVKKTLLDLGASVNLLPYSVYKQLGLGELKSTNITLSLADRSVKYPRGIIEDVLIQIDKFYYPVDFVVLDTEQGTSGLNHVPIILGRPFLATANALINCRSGVMQLTFGNMTIELNIFHSDKGHDTKEEELMDACLLNSFMEEPMEKIVEANFEHIDGLNITARVKMKQLLSLKKKTTMKHAMCNKFNTIKKKLKKWHAQLKCWSKFKEDYPKPNFCSQKLKYHGIGPYEIHQVHPTSMVELTNPKNRHAFKVNGQHLKPYFMAYIQDKEELHLLDPP